MKIWLIFVCQYVAYVHGIMMLVATCRWHYDTLCLPRWQWCYLHTSNITYSRVHAWPEYRMAQVGCLHKQATLSCMCACVSCSWTMWNLLAFVLFSAPADKAIGISPLAFKWGQTIRHDEAKDVNWLWVARGNEWKMILRGICACLCHCVYVWGSGVCMPVMLMNKLKSTNPHVLSYSCRWSNGYLSSAWFWREDWQSGRMKRKDVNWLCE